jgi:hypothetical protein
MTMFARACLDNIEKQRGPRIGPAFFLKMHYRASTYRGIAADESYTREGMTVSLGL